MRKALASSILLLFAVFANAQNFPSEFWHSGKILLMSGDTLKGEVKYNMTTDVVQYKIGERIQTFTSQKVLYFEIFDLKKN